MATCVADEGCDRPAKTKGLCQKHYMREWSARTRGFCSVEGCHKNPYSGGLCGMHYQRRRTEGDPGEAAPRFMQGATVGERLLAKVDFAGPVPEYAPHLGPCWLWTAGKFQDGYGNLVVDGTSRGAHRVAYELLRDPIPDGLQLDHLCRVRHCVNPWHLEPVTQAVNIGRGAPAMKTGCKRGHDLTDPANLKPNSRGARQCRACSNISRRNRYARLGR